MKTLCGNGNTIESWYDRKTRSSVIQTLDAAGNQIGDANYSGNKKSAAFTRAQIIKKNGGEKIVKRPVVIEFYKKPNSYCVRFIDRKPGQRHFAASFYAPDHTRADVEKWVTENPKLELTF